MLTGFPKETGCPGVITVLTHKLAMNGPPAMELHSSLLVLFWQGTRNSYLSCLGRPNSTVPYGMAAVAVLILQPRHP
jgi:hypothetical protein